MAKTVRRFHANFLRITMDYGGKEQKVSKQNQQKVKVPEAPKMCWNKDGSPCFSHLTEDKETQKVHRKNVEQMRVPAPPKMRWNSDGSPDFGHL